MDQTVSTVLVKSLNSNTQTNVFQPVNTKRVLWDSNRTDM